MARRHLVLDQGPGVRAVLETAAGAPPADLRVGHQRRRRRAETPARPRLDPARLHRSLQRFRALRTLHHGIEGRRRRAHWSRRAGRTTPGQPGIPGWIPGGWPRSLLPRRLGRSSWVYVWETGDWTHELDYPAAYVNSCLAPFALGDRWIYRDNYRS